MVLGMRSDLLINGRWAAPLSKDEITAINPATEEVFHRFAAGGVPEVDAAVCAARQAFEEPWRRTTGRDRAAVLRAIAAAIEADKQRLAEWEVMDNGKPLPEALWDVSDAAACFTLYADYAEELDDRQDEAIALPDPRFVSRVRREPIGAAGLVIPWNYPLLMAAWKVAPAIAAGCTMVLKPSEYTSVTALELGAIALDAGLPPGVLNVVTGLGAVAGAALVRHPEVRKIAFTGSVPTGAGIAAAAAQDIKAVSLELGGKSPIIVFDDCGIEAAVEWILFGIFWNQGEVCSATSRLIVQKTIAPKLIDRLIAEAKRIVIGDGMTPGVLLGPLVSARQHERVLGFIRDGKRVANLATGGGRPAHCPRGYFVEPTIFTDVPADSALWTEEIFGPVLAVRTFENEAEALRLANDSRFGLAAAVMSADLARADRVAEALEAGVVWINCSQPTFAEAPWGGMKQSGIGRELGRWGLANYLEVKQITRYASPEPWGWYLK
jgi:betaine-aldehyde dehydrogenase